MRSVFYFISQDEELIQKAEDFCHTNGLSLQLFSPEEWEDFRKSPSNVTNMSARVATKSAQPENYKSHNEDANVLQFSEKSNEKGIVPMTELECSAIKNAILVYNGNFSEAAIALGIGRATLYRKVKQYDINPTQTRQKAKAA